MQKNPYGTTVTYIKNVIPEMLVSEIKGILDTAIWAKYEYGTWRYVEILKATNELSQLEHGESEPSVIDTNTEAGALETIDFTNIPALAYTKPISISYFGEIKDNFHSWTELYTVFFTILYEDYSHNLKIGMSFTEHNDGRVELGNAEMAKLMKAPKPIATADGEILYIETNLSTFSIVGKIKFLLDLCVVDYENVIISYSETENEFEGSSVRSQNGSTQNENQNNFFYNLLTQWMQENGCAYSTIRSYISGIRFAETYAKEHVLESQILVSEDHDLCLKTVAALFQDEEFIELNQRQHNRFRAAITKLLEYYGIQNDFKSNTITPKPVVSVQQKPRFDTAPFEKVLAEKFVRGFRIDSPLDMKKFRRFYEEINGVVTELSDSEVEAALLACGIRYDDKIFAPAAMLPAEIRDKLFSFIRASFSEGKQAVYYEALFRSFSDVFLDYYIYDAQMLKAYIAFYNHGEFHLEGQYICKDTLIQANPLEEVKNYLITAGVPVESTEICETLSHIPQKKVMQILGANAEFVYDGKSRYFHVDIVYLSEEEMENMAELIQEGIRDKLFLSGNELIHARYPFIIDNNQAISVLGMRDALKYYLKDRFSFKGNIISGLDHALSMADVFGNYAQSRPEFTVEELITLASELNSSVYFDAVYDNSLRISREQFVSKERAQFRIGETDRAIDRFCNGSYIAIEKVDGFGAFPDAGFPWNAYLLEHYVYAYSKKYRLLHVGFNQDCCVGAIVKDESGIQTFDDLLSLALAQSDILLKKEHALAFFVKEGYLARRNYSNIENVLIQANTYRNRKGTR